MKYDEGCGCRCACAFLGIQIAFLCYRMLKISPHSRVAMSVSMHIGRYVPLFALGQRSIAFQSSFCDFQAFLHPFQSIRVKTLVSTRALSHRPHRTVRMCTTTVRIRYCRVKSVRGKHDIISQPQRAPFGRSNACFRCGSFACVRPFPSVALGS